MKFKIYQIQVAAIVLLLLFSMTSYAGNKDKAGTVAASELLIPVGARDLAMGGSTIAKPRARFHRTIRPLKFLAVC